MSGYVMVPEWFSELNPKGIDVKLYIQLARFGTWSPLTGEYVDITPKIETLAAKLQVSHDTVERSLARLVGLGAVVRTHRRRAGGEATSNSYRVIFGSVVQSAPAKPPRKLSKAPKSPGADPSTSKRSSAGDDASVPAGVSPDVIGEAPKSPGAGYAMPSASALETASKVIDCRVREGVHELSSGDELRLVRAVARAVDRGWDHDRIFRILKRGTVAADSVVAVLLTRVKKEFGKVCAGPSRPLSASEKCPVHRAPLGNCSGCRADALVEKVEAQRAVK